MPGPGQSGKGRRPGSGRPAPETVVVGGGGERAAAFAASCAELGWPVPTFCSWRDAFDAGLHARVADGPLLRIDSPSDDPANDAWLVELGGGSPPPTGALLPFDAWYAGLARVLTRIDEQSRHLRSRLQNPSELRMMFDKEFTAQTLHNAGVPVPESFSTTDAAGDTVDGTELLARARAAGWSQAIVKPRYGSSASGLVALRWHGDRIIARSTVEVTDAGCYNSRRLQTYRDGRAIRLLDALSRQPLRLERWIPKMSLDGATADFRVVVIGGRARHVLLRCAHGPFTNLHLGARRGNVATARAELGGRYVDVLGTAEDAVACFPDTWYAGVDVLVPRQGRARVVEVNAFGDFHTGVRWRGLDTYQCELRTFVAARGNRFDA
ncbi:STM4014 family protein [Granulicoccus phenolivorans]|uniref:STM4014 family protein n=1 Tax=Granulicoccus phenolivorans TaxID=266854 RepID=UPI00040AD7C4|nr:STM4014 family protein [Granulicoccus phenolivorans]